MSFDYRACFILGTDPIDALRLESTFASFGLAFAGAFTSLIYEAGRVKEVQAPQRDWPAFIANGNEPAPSAFGQVKAEEFRFDFGFVTLPGLLDAPAPFDSLIRAVWLEMSDQNLYDMALDLEDQESNLVRFVVALYSALKARSMALGMETSALQFMQFFGGQLPLAEINERISVAIAPPAESAAAMRQSPWLREIDVGGVHVLTRYLKGLEEYFPRIET
jgi:hypothetical protein